jgi:DNA-binding protein H-NS
MDILNKVSELNFADLLNLREAVDAEIKARQAEERAKAKKQILELAKTFNISVEDVLSKGVAGRKPVEAKYRHPGDSSLTWTGRGRKPAWVQSLLDQGKSLDDLLIG